MQHNDDDDDDDDDDDADADDAGGSGDGDADDNSFTSLHSACLKRFAKRQPYFCKWQLAELMYECMHIYVHILSHMIIYVHILYNIYIYVYNDI